MAKYSTLWAFLQNNYTPPPPPTVENTQPETHSIQKPVRHFGYVKKHTEDLQAKQFAAEVTCQALTAQKKSRPKAEQQWQVVLPQPPVWPVVWASYHKGLNTRQENEVSYLITHRVMKTLAYLKFKCSMNLYLSFA